MKHNILKSLFLAAIFMAGTSNVWGEDFQGQGSNAGWFANEGLILTWNKNGSSSTTKMNYSSISSGGSLGDITTKLTLTKMEAKIWRVSNYGNICDATIFWELYKGDTKIAGSSEVSSSFGTWSGNDCSISKTLSIDFLAKTTGPGSYTIRVYGKLTGRSQNSYYNDPSYLGCGDNFWYNNNNSGYYSITFTIPSKKLTVANDGHGTTTGSVNDIVKGTAYAITATANEGYSFEKWTKTSGDNSISIADANSTNTTVTFNDYANDGKVTASFTANTYTVTLDNQGASKAGATSVTATYNSAMPSIANNLPEKKGYTFGGYWTNKGGTGTQYYKSDGSSAAIWKLTSSLTLYAHWTPTTYTITYHNLEGGSNHANNPFSYTIETPTITLQAPTKERYTFEGWYQQADFSGDKVTQIAKGTTGHLNLYAKWSETKYSVNIYSNNSTYGLTTPSGATWVGPTPVEITATPHNGYRFTEWTATGGATINNTNSATTFVTATSAGTVIAHFVESLYDITVQASNDAHGKVTQSATQAGVTTAITITAEPIEGYEFTGWSKTGDITIASINSATTTLTATSEGTVTANFAPKGSTPIYFKANHRWKQANARFAIYYWGEKGEGWDNLEKICGEDYYKAEVPAGYTNFLFVRLDPNSTTNSFNKDNGFWNQSANGVVPTDGRTLFNAQKVYFRPNANWKRDNARFAAYFYSSSNGDHNTWMSLLPTDTEDLYWCDLPTEYDRVIFCRMTPSDTYNKWENRWNEAEPKDVLEINCFTINDGQWGGDPNKQDDPKATGYWSLVSEEPTYNVTLYSSSFGEYGFICNNVQYASPQSGSITYQVPINATVKVYSTPYSKEYRGDVMVNQTGDRWEISPDNPLLNITCNTILDDNYKTKGEHEVYLAIPTSQGASWHEHPATLHYLYAFHDRTDSGKGYAVEMKEVGRATIQLSGSNVEHIYYRCVIPAEVNTIRFEKRTDATTTDLQTIDLRYDIPLNDVNCYRLDRKNGNYYAGVWEQAPGFGGDFRLVHHRASGVIYPSDVIRHGTISQVVSLHIYTEDANDEYPKLELQQRNSNGEWVTVPGQTKLVKDINRIKNDKQDKGCGVWNFTVTTDGANHATVNFNTPQRYTGNYYIRTNNAEGGWRNYTLSTNHMTFSSYAKNHSGYTHYFCRWIDVIENSTVPGHNKNVKFIIANDYATVLSNELAGDSHTTAGGDLPESANVRWTWNEVTNDVSRAYILGSHGTTDHIVAKNSRLSEQKRLHDQEDWVYEIDMEHVKQSDKLNIHATYPSTKISGVAPVTQTFADELEMIHADANNQNEYTIRVMYDFKINKTLIMLLPDQIKDANIGVDIFIDRTDQDTATQVRSTVTSTEGYTVYATLTLTKEHLLGDGTEWERLYYWISFPFDVRISEIFGFGEYGKHWIIQYYDGAERAKNGCWADSPTYWRQITDTTYSARREENYGGNEDENGNPNNGILVANKGYVLALARNIAKSDIFEHNNDYVRLYFPSREKIHSIDQNMQNTTVYLMPHTCTIERDNRYIYDSNWHIIGAPSYADNTQKLTQDSLLYYYAYNPADNTYTAYSAEGDSVPFLSMWGYMVQFAGNIKWQSEWEYEQESQSVSARQQSAQAAEQYALRLELQRDGQYADQTFIQLQAEGATADYDMNQDLTKIINTGANIYTLAGEKHIQLAGNVLPIAKTTIPVGVQVSQAGTYTIALPEGSDGILATLVDNLTGTHTNLLLDNYTITLDAGNHENRFYIVLDPDRAATAVENIGDETNEAQKYLIDGQLIIKHDGIKYNVQGDRL